MPHFSTESRDRLAAEIIEQSYWIVAAETWNELAPKKNMTYRGHIRFAVGMFGSDNLNPTVIACELRSKTDELDSSPWFYDALMDLVQNWASAGHYANDPLPNGWPKIEEGGVYEWRGTFRNYKFDGTLKRMTLGL